MQSLNAALRHISAPLLKVYGAFVSKNFNGHHSFLIPAYTGLGNFILKTPFIRALREQFPAAKIDLLAGNSYGTEFVLSGSGLIDETLIFPIHGSIKEQVHFYRGLRGRYSTTFLFFDTAHVNHLYYGSILAEIPSRIGHFDPSVPLDSLPWASLTEPVAIKFGTHEVDLNFDLLERVVPGIRRSYDQFISLPLLLPVELQKQLDHFQIREKNFIVLQLSAANGLSTPKTWPPSHFQTLISRLLEHKYKIVTLGDKPEKDLSESILRPFGGNVLNLVGKTSVNQAAFIIQKSRGLVCHDSGLMHMSNALKTPLIAIFGPTDYEKNRPLALESHVLRSDLPCMPCLKQNGGWTETEAVLKCPIHMQCMQNITPEIVFQKVVESF